MEPELFKNCLYQAASENFGSYDFYRDVIVNDDWLVTGFYFTIKTKPLDDPGKDLPKMLKNLRSIESTYGLGDTFSYNEIYLEIEIYAILAEEILTMLTFALLIVTAMVLLITFNVKMTLIVVFLVLLVVLFMVGTCHFWGLTMNNFFAINMTFALGIAIDFSVHIAHKYLVIVPPKELKTN